MAEIEKEFKNLITKENYEEILNDYQKILTTSITQTNSYYDYQGILKSHHIALRIRTIEGQSTGEITLKIPQDTYEVLEITETLPIDMLQSFNAQKEFTLPEKIYKALVSQDINLKNVQQTALLTTHRRQGTLSANELLVLDESHYNGRCDYEIEMEVNDLQQGERVFNQFLHQYGIKRQQADSKIKRALSTAL